VRELVIAIADLYLVPGEAEPGPASAPLPALTEFTRYGVRAALPGGWRRWLLGHLGHEDLIDLSEACIAGAVGGPAPAAATRWLAAPLHLAVGPGSARLSRDGRLRLAADEARSLTASFAAGFPGAALTELTPDTWLLDAPGLAPVPLPEPARCFGHELAEFVPRGAAAAALRRLTGEIELWLHALPLNTARAARADATLSTLWLWGGAGRQAHPRAGGARDSWLAFGGDAFVRGLWHLRGGACGGLAQAVAALPAAAAGALWVLEVGQELQHDAHDMTAALAHLDATYLAPALAALHRGALGRVTLLANDTRLTLTRGSRFRLWRRGRAGLAGLT
jgi:hypothetical protein